MENQHHCDNDDAHKGSSASADAGNDCETHSSDIQYRYRWDLPRLTRGFFTFEVQTNNDVHVALSSMNQDLDDMYEIVIGGWSNTQSVIRRGKQGSNLVTASTPGINSREEYRKFRITWSSDGTIAVERRGETQWTFMQWTDPNPLPINYAGYSTGWGSDGLWKFYAELAVWDPLHQHRSQIIEDLKPDVEGLVKYLSREDVLTEQDLETIGDEGTLEDEDEDEDEEKGTAAGDIFNSIQNTTKPVEQFFKSKDFIAVEQAVQMNRAFTDRPVTVLYGPGGSGKTQISRNLAREVLQHYPTAVAYMIEGRDQDCYLRSLLSLLKELNVDQPVGNIGIVGTSTCLQKAFLNRDTPVFLIVEDLEDGSFVRPDLIPNMMQFRMVIITRKDPSQLQLSEGVHKRSSFIEMKGFQGGEELGDFLKEKLPEQEYQIKDLQDLNDLFDGNPLGLAVVAEYVRRNRISLGNCIASLKDEKTAKIIQQNAKKKWLCQHYDKFEEGKFHRSLQVAVDRLARQEQVAPGQGVTSSQGSLQETSMKAAPTAIGCEESSSSSEDLTTQEGSFHYGMKIQRALYGGMEGVEQHSARQLDTARKMQRAKPCEGMSGKPSEKRKQSSRGICGAVSEDRDNKKKKVPCNGRSKVEGSAVRDGKSAHKAMAQLSQKKETQKHNAEAVTKTLPNRQKKARKPKGSAEHVNRMTASRCDKERKGRDEQEYTPSSTDPATQQGSFQETSMEADPTETECGESSSSSEDPATQEGSLQDGIKIQGALYGGMEGVEPCPAQQFETARKMSHPKTSEGMSGKPSEKRKQSSRGIRGAVSEDRDNKKKKVPCNGRSKVEGSAVRDGKSALKAMARPSQKKESQKHNAAVEIKTPPNRRKKDRKYPRGFDEHVNRMTASRCDKKSKRKDESEHTKFSCVASIMDKDRKSKITLESVKKDRLSSGKCSSDSAMSSQAGEAMKRSARGIDVEKRKSKDERKSNADIPPDEEIPTTPKVPTSPSPSIRANQGSTGTIPKVLSDCQGDRSKSYDEMQYCRPPEKGEKLGDESSNTDSTESLLDNNVEKDASTSTEPIIEPQDDKVLVDVEYPPSGPAALIHLQNELHPRCHLTEVSVRTDLYHPEGEESADSLATTGSSLQKSVVDNYYKGLILPGEVYYGQTGQVYAVPYTSPSGQAPRIQIGGNAYWLPDWLTGACGAEDIDERNLYLSATETVYLPRRHPTDGVHQQCQYLNSRKGRTDKDQNGHPDDLIVDSLQESFFLDANGWVTWMVPQPQPPEPDPVFVKVLNTAGQLVTEVRVFGAVYVEDLALYVAEQVFADQPLVAFTLRWPGGFNIQPLTLVRQDMTLQVHHAPDEDQTWVWRIIPSP
ncbi:uncharacterized protein LOC118424952 [Branchiostoma floridae]|uniref:Uncharacterized protein LOC118424952 n=1 Tax=Branchiostoma floridae TaxID=7739 RepID=A0A9J7LV28_BRAFL|nr:uncharacterized protein LOC118424952 [Branchiostoma floridae]